MGKTETIEKKFTPYSSIPKIQLSLGLLLIPLFHHSNIPISLGAKRTIDGFPV
jgi:hypothetical protein